MQAVEVMQALGDQIQLGHSLQLPAERSSQRWALVKCASERSSSRPTPFQKKLSAMMDGLKEDKAKETHSVCSRSRCAQFAKLRKMSWCAGTSPRCF